MNSKLVTAARIALGLVFFVFGWNGFLHFIPAPPPSGTMATFAAGLVATGYFFPFLKGTEILAGTLLLSKRYVPLALAVLAPIVLNIVAVHVFLAPSGLPLAVLVLALEIFLAWSYRAVYHPMLQAQPEPARAPKPELAHAAE